ncbi:MAG: hypothetical protein OHK0012_10910 [Synechococcales cyanobacterium]
MSRAAALQRLGGSLPPISEIGDPDSPWPLRILDDHLYIGQEGSEWDWAEAIALLRLPRLMTLTAAFPADALPPLVLDLAWGLTRVTWATELDAILKRAGYDREAGYAEQVQQWVNWGSHRSELSRVLGVLELLVRGIPTSAQTELKAALGDDVMRAAYQMNLICIDPEQRDRTLLQVQRIALRLAGEQGSHLRSALRLVLSDGRQVELV